mmetsp:Transcript_5356/g.12786  ORF Transcript_5356/g.12786 Transcript_5356/m.12786 type:complete len:575 (+) Transcript_5356:156-1880(+)|eukprot:CAMPEP_0206452936 /NCGR_PEP_ID=MMETSP0324_2-20121206/20239_1 /ASSEMBLY_ACC=CAM_ASM_000836 /TAXON_ID=2866 /ORGANISM="Crypthecodinium cohnii, Strain Seligo" /LENGTH=574 /DNA_ID=CAMNT_0053923115 /DNA_START=97 /DNA_END=1821 /DNA_ORIENTATION=+
MAPQTRPASFQATRLTRSHPLCIYPLGNALLDGDAPRRRRAGLGAFSRCDDEVVLAILRWLSPESLARGACASGTLRAYAYQEEFWKEFCVAKVLAGAPFVWPAKARAEENCNEEGEDEEGSWRLAYTAMQVGGSSASSAARKSTIKKRVYSDVLYRSFYYAACELDPHWFSRENMAQIDAGSITVEDFIRDYERKSVPVLLKGAGKDWPSMNSWSRETLVERFPEADFLSGPCEIPLKEFYKYADRNMDDTPLFVFCRRFGQKAPAMLQEYKVPEVFRNRDLFDLLGEHRPANRWLLVGNKRSASKWHIDPNKTCAWNTVVKGRKRWLMLPPGCVPPGVFTDGADVTQPVSLVEWFCNFYRQLRELADTSPAWDLKEVTCGPGDCVFVPCGWWHCVLNLDDDTIAITQNYCSEAVVHSVRRFLREKKDLVSGIRGEDREVLWQLFDEALARERPDLLNAEAAKAELEAEYHAQAVKEASPSESPSASGSAGGSFSFWDHLRSTGRSLGFASQAPEAAMTRTVSRDTSSSSSDEEEDEQEAKEEDGGLSAAKRRKLDGGCAVDATIESQSPTSA